MVKLVDTADRKNVSENKTDLLSLGIDVIMLFVENSYWVGRFFKWGCGGMVDTPHLGCGFERSVRSSRIIPTKFILMERRLTHKELLHLDSDKIKGTKEYIRYVNVYEEKDGTMSICHNLFVLKNDAIMAGMESPNYRYSKEIRIVV